MSSLIVRHRVADFDAWRARSTSTAPRAASTASIDTGLLRDEGDDNMVTVLLSTDDPGRAREFFGSDSLREAMEGAGVVSQPDDVDRERRLAAGLARRARR